MHAAVTRTCMFMLCSHLLLCYGCKIPGNFESGKFPPGMLGIFVVILGIFRNIQKLQEFENNFVVRTDLSI